MKKATVALVAVMLVLAGCSGGGGTATPTDTANDAEDGEMDGTMTPESDDGTPDSDDDSDSDSDSTDTSQGLSFNEVSAADSALDRPSEISIDYVNDSQSLSVVIRNDTQNEIYRVTNNQESGERVYYITDGVDAFRDTATGETVYAEAGNNTVDRALGEDIFLGLLSVQYFDMVTWEQTGTRTVDGDTRTVYEPLALNETAIDSPFIGFNSSDVQSFEGEVVSGSDGILRSGTIRLDTPQGRLGSDIAITIDSSITVEQPDWYDESQVPN